MQSACALEVDIDIDTAVVCQLTANHFSIVHLDRVSVFTVEGGLGEKNEERKKCKKRERGKGEKVGGKRERERERVCVWLIDLTLFFNGKDIST